MTKDIHVIALDQTIITAKGRVPNHDIRTWSIQTVDDVPLALLHKLAPDLYKMESDWFGQHHFENLVDARDFVQDKLDHMQLN